MATYQNVHVSLANFTLNISTGQTAIAFPSGASGRSIDVKGAVVQNVNIYCNDTTTTGTHSTTGITFAGASSAPTADLAPHVKDCSIFILNSATTAGACNGIILSGSNVPVIVEGCSIKVQTGGGATGNAVSSDGTSGSSSLSLYNCNLSATTADKSVSGGPINFYNVQTTNNVVNIDSGSKITGNFVTSPATTNSIAGTTVVSGTPFQNTLGYDAVYIIYMKLPSSAGTGTVVSGVGSSSTPTTQTIVSSTTIAALTIIPITLYIPSGFYGSVSTTGFTGVTILGQSVMPV